MIEHFIRQPDDNWLIVTAFGLDASLQIASLGCTMNLPEVYWLIEFPVEEKETDEEDSTQPANNE